MKSGLILCTLATTIFTASQSMAETYSGDFNCIATNYTSPTQYARRGRVAAMVSGAGTELEKQEPMTCSENICYSLGGDPSIFQHTTIIEVFRDERGVLTAKNTFVIYPILDKKDPGGVIVSFEEWECRQ